VFWHDCANAIWSLKGPKGPHLSILVVFICKKISISLQRMQASSILSWAIIISLVISQLPPLHDTPAITMANLLQAINFWHGKIWPTYYRQPILDMERFWHLFWTNLTSWNFSLFFFHTLFITPKKQFVYKYNIVNKYSDEWDNLQSQIKHYANIHQTNEWQNLISNDIINVNNPEKIKY
jgi:hypothetical protein